MPESAMIYHNLAEVLRTRGDFADSLAMYRKAQEFDTGQLGYQPPSARLIAEYERLAALTERLSRLLKGEGDPPKDAAECLALAEMCFHKKLYTAATRFLSDALNAEPSLGDDREAQHRYNGACAAALAATGKGKDSTPTDEAAKVKLRGQALGWLRDELETWKTVLASGPIQSRPAVAKTLVDWRRDPDLSTIRDPEALAMLAEVERKEWQSLWADVDALLKRARQESP